MIDFILRQAMERQSRATRAAAILAVIAAASAVSLLAVSGWFLTGAALAGAGGVGAVKVFNYLLPSAAIRTLAISRTLSRYGERLFSHRAALFALSDIRPVLFEKLVSADPKAILTRPAGEVAAQLGSDVDALEDAAIRKVTTPSALAAGGVALAAAALSGWASALALVIGFVAMFLAARVMARKLVPQWVQMRALAMADLKTAYADYAPCAADIHAYGLAPMVASALSGQAQALDKARAGEVRAEALIMGVQTTLAACVVGAVLALSANGPAFAALSTLAAAGGAEIWANLARNIMQAERVRNAIDRLSQLAYATARPMGEPWMSTPSLHISTLKQDCHIRPGQRVRIDGPTGSGKSRLLGTLIGLRNDAPESLRIEGEDVQDIGLNRLRSLFAYAPQDALLMAGTVADNLRLARTGVDEAAMWQALETACAASFVRQLPNGLDTWLGSDGARLSGGQRKRLALARALLAERPWLVLDEPSEGLDAATEAELGKRLMAYLDATDCGLILVSHRRGLHHLTGLSITLS